MRKMHRIKLIGLGEWNRQQCDYLACTSLRNQSKTMEKIEFNNRTSMANNIHPRITYKTITININDDKKELKQVSATTKIYAEHKF